MPEQLLVVLNVCLVILLYLFFARVLRAVWIEMKEPVTVAAGSVPARAARKRSSSKRTAQAPAIPSKLVGVAPPAREGIEQGLTAEMTIGRAPGCTIVLDDQYVSSLHTRVFRDADSWMVEDLGSKNGTTIGGKRINGPRALRVGDRLAVGSNEWDVR